MNANLVGDFSKTIDHEKVMDLLGITMLVYDYSKKFTFDKDETIETFVYKQNKKFLRNSR